MYFSTFSQKTIHTFNKGVGGGPAKKIDFVYFDTCCSPIFLLSKMGSYVSQLSLVFVLHALTWKTICSDCLNFHFFQILSKIVKNGNFGQNLKLQTALKLKKIKISKIAAYHFCITLKSTYMNKFGLIWPAVFSNLVNFS